MRDVKFARGGRRRSALSLWCAIVAPILVACGGTGDSTDPGGGGAFGVFATITNLQGSGLVLQNNGAGDFSVPSGGDRAFWQNIAKKASYNVSVKTQPTEPWQTCTVSNGSGTVSADVNNIAVACSINTYSVRGSVAGLTANGLSLAINGGSAQTIAIGTATFSFGPIASGATYAVTVASQPAGQTCIVGNSSGKVGGADVSAVTVTCGATGFTVGGDVGAGASGLTLRLNGGTPIVVNADALTFTFPATLQTGASWNIVVVDEPASPKSTCTVVRGRGKIGAANSVASQVLCISNANLAGYEGTYSVVRNGRKQFVTVWLDGSVTVALRSDDVTCPNAGNGIEFGVYRRSADGTFQFRIAREDTNGGCGLSDPAVAPGAGPQGTLQRSNDTMTLTLPGNDPIVSKAVESVSGSLIGAWTRVDGFDGSVIVFESDGTYMYADPQGTPSMNAIPGYERGCYTINGAAFTTSLGASCKPDALSAIDTNGPGAGFSVKNGTAISFTITGPNAVTIDGVQYRRLQPAG